MRREKEEAEERANEDWERFKEMEARKFRENLEAQLESKAEEVRRQREERRRLLRELRRREQEAQLEVEDAKVRSAFLVQWHFFAKREAKHRREGEAAHPSRAPAALPPGPPASSQQPEPEPSAPDRRSLREALAGRRPSRDEDEDEEDEEQREGRQLGLAEDDVAAWRRAVQSLLEHGAATLGAEDLEEVVELRDLLLEETSAEDRMELLVQGNRPVLVTAPHSIYLLRDGHSPHRVEDRTAELAAQLAGLLGGTSLTWRAEEQRRSELLVSLCKKLGAEVADHLDPRNRDPNYLLVAELDGNPWFQRMCTTAGHWRSQLGNGAATLHVDVHGCRDPPDSPSHLTVGLGAMHARADGQDALQAFKAALERELEEVLKRLAPVLKPRTPGVPLARVVLPDSRDGSHHERFSGAWTACCLRHTQSQQAINFAGFTHSVQLELSKALRRALARDRVEVSRFGNALRAAWVKAKQAPGAAVEDGAGS